MKKKSDFDRMPVNIQCRCLAIKAGMIAGEIFMIEDMPPYDGRTVAQKYRAMERMAKRIYELSGVPVDKLASVLYNVGGTWGQYLNGLRALGVPIADYDEYQKYIGGME